MHATYIKHYGGPERIEVGELPDPKPRGSEVVIDVRAASVNPLDWKVLGGMTRYIPGAGGFPRVLGSDVAGVVRELGPAAQGLAVGDRVMGFIFPMRFKTGAFAERALGSADQMARMPDGVSFDDAATLPVAALTALQGLRDILKLSAGQQVLIHGASGGVGHFAVQVARMLGIEAHGTASKKNAEFVRSLGASSVYDHAGAPPPMPYAAVYDAAAKLRRDQLSDFVAPGGHYVTTVPGAWFFAQKLNPFLGRKLSFQNMKANRKDFELLLRWVDEGSLKPTIAQTYPLEHAADALRDAMAGGAPGKRVIHLDRGERA